MSTSHDATIRSFVKARASLDPDEVAYRFHGTAYRIGPAPLADGLMADGLMADGLMAVEGFELVRAEAVGAGFEIVSRSVLLYADPVSGAILDEWTDPSTGLRSEVEHLWRERDSATADALAGLAAHPHGTEVHFMTSRHGGPCRYISPASALADQSPSAPCWMSWVPVGPSPSWLCSGGQLLHHIVGTKLGGYPSLPGGVREYVERRRPEFAFAPRLHSRPAQKRRRFFSARSSRSG